MAKEGGCKWNNNLAHEIFEDNSEKFGKEKALQLLRNDVQSWVRERDGKKFDFSYLVQNNKLENEELGKSLTGMIQDSIDGPHVKTLAANVRENAPLELSTAEEVTKRAVRGDKEIKFLEYYRTENGETVVRYVTVLTQDANDKRRYNGNRIDLGENFSVEEALKRAGEKVVIPEPIQPRYSAAHTVIREVPRDALYVVSHTASEIGYTVRSVQRYIEKRKEEKIRAKNKKIDLKSVGVWKRVMEPGKKRIRKIDRGPNRPVPIERVIMSAQAKKSIEKSIARHERKMKKRIVRKEIYARILLKPEMRADGLKKKRKMITAEKIVSRKRKLLSGERRIFSKKIMKKESVGKMKAEKRSEVKKNKEKIVRLFFLAKKLIQIREKMFLRRLDKAEFRQKIQERVLNFSIVFIYWILLSKHYHIPEHDNKQEKKKLTDYMKQKEQTFWLIQAIIYYLVMKREQGQVQQPQPKQKKVKKQLHYSQFAPRGVIFAYTT